VIIGDGGGGDLQYRSSTLQENVGSRWCHCSPSCSHQTIVNDSLPSHQLCTSTSTTFSQCGHMWRSYFFPDIPFLWKKFWFPLLLFVSVVFSTYPLLSHGIWPLTEYDPPNDKLLFFAKGDSLDPNGINVVEATAIEGTAFVLPYVENPGDDFPTSQETASYFLVFPPRSEWIHNW